jgi:ankyrin repeat protein
LTHLLVVLICSLYWFNPLAWIALRRLHYEREVACDDSVLNAGTRASTYARYLMEVTMNLTECKSMHIIPAVMAHSSNIGRRLMSVLSDGANHRPLGRFATLGCLLVALGIALPTATFRPWSVAAAINGSAAEERVRIIHGVDTKNDKGGKTALHRAATYGHLDVAVELIEAGADPNARDAGLRTPLHQAATYGHSRVAGLLLEQGADVDARDDNLETPLFEAACYGHRDVARILLEAGADARAYNEDLETPLHEAAAYGHEEVARLLIDCGALPDAVDEDGQMPLHTAAIYGHAGVSELLLNAGVDPNAVDHDGRTALDEAATYGHVDVVRLLLRYMVE